MAMQVPRPELARAVRDLLLAERDFTRTYTAWSRADETQREKIRAELERAERSVDVAQREVIRRQPDSVS